MKKSPRIHFFKTPAAMRAWLETNHRREAELHVGYYKRHAVGAGKLSITGAESVAEALCFGWIDGVVTPLDADTLLQTVHAATPGQQVEAALNIRTIAELEAAKRMTDAGRAVFEARKDSRSAGLQSREESRFAG